MTKNILHIFKRLIMLPLQGAVSRAAIFPGCYPGLEYIRPSACLFPGCPEGAAYFSPMATPWVE